MAFNSTHFTHSIAAYSNERQKNPSLRADVRLFLYFNFHHPVMDSMIRWEGLLAFPAQKYGMLLRPWVFVIRMSLCLDAYLE